MNTTVKKKRFPPWLTIHHRPGKNSSDVESILRTRQLHTVCEEAACPNRNECFGRRTAAFMILGSVCSRNCAFCNIHSGQPQQPDDKEPQRIAEAAAALGLKHVVITSVTRDDLADGGSGFFAETIFQVRRRCPDVSIEVLIPDFKGEENALRTVIAALPDIINHNIETVPRLYPAVRPQAVYSRSLNLLKRVSEISSIPGKSGIMLGMGELYDEVLAVLRDLRAHGADIITIGQYLAPSSAHYPVAEFVHPDVFEKIRKYCLDIGFTYAASAPFVRSSYNAEEAVRASGHSP